MSGEAKKRPLKRQEELFCRLYAGSFNGTASAITAGYGLRRGGTPGNPKDINGRAAAVAACRLLKKPEIAARIEEIGKNAASEAGATPLYIAKKLRQIAERCLQEVHPVKKFDQQSGKLVETGEFVFNASGANKALATLADIQGMRSEKLRMGNIENENLRIELADEVKEFAE